MLFLSLTPVSTAEGSSLSPVATTEENYCLVARLLGSFVGNEYIHFIFDTCVVGTLLDYVRSKELENSAERPGLVEAEVAYIASCIISGVDFLHSKSIVTRSIDMTSLQVDESGMLVLTSLSLGKILEDEVDRAHTICGDPMYFAPEQIFNQGASLAVDWWETGLILYELLYGFLPYEQQLAPSNPSLENSATPEGLETTESAQNSFFSNNLTEAQRFALISDFKPELISFDLLVNGSTLSTEAQKLIRQLLDPNPETRKELDGKLRSHPWLAKHSVKVDQIESHANSPLFPWCEKQIESYANVPEVDAFDEDIPQDKPDTELAWLKPFYDKV